jgi:hypothetical protein
MKLTEPAGGRAVPASKRAATRPALVVMVFAAAAAGLAGCGDGSLAGLGKGRSPAAVSSSTPGDGAPDTAGPSGKSTSVGSSSPGPSGGASSNR